MRFDAGKVQNSTAEQENDNQPQRLCHVQVPESRDDIEHDQDVGNDVHDADGEGVVNSTGTFVYIPLPEMRSPALEGSCKSGEDCPEDNSSNYGVE